MDVDHSKFMTDLPTDDLDKLRNVSDTWADGVKTNLMDQIQRGNEELHRIQTAQQNTRAKIDELKQKRDHIESERNTKSQKLEKEWMAKQAEVENLRAHINTLKVQMAHSVVQSQQLDPQIEDLTKELLDKQSNAKLQKSVNSTLHSKYQSLLGLRIEAMEQEDELQFIMNNVDPSDYDREVSFVLALHNDYEVKECSPDVPAEETASIVAHLKDTSEFGTFLKQMRSALKSRV